MSKDSQRSKRSGSKWTRTAWTWLSALVFWSSVSSCAAFGLGRARQPVQPPREICVVGDAGCLCFDPRLPVDKQSYVRSFADCRNYIGTNPMDYDGQQAWISQNCYGKPK